MAEDRSSTSNRGFASMDQERQRQIASKGGQSVPGEKRSFSQNRELAAQAGRKGGQASHGGGRSAASGRGNGADSKDVSRRAGDTDAETREAAPE